jgi:hypothetical protein
MAVFLSQVLHPLSILSGEAQLAYPGLLSVRLHSILTRQARASIADAPAVRPYHPRQPARDLSESAFICEEKTSGPFGLFSRLHSISAQQAVVEFQPPFQGLFNFAIWTHG